MPAFVNLVSRLCQHICDRYKFGRLCIKLPKSILVSRTFYATMFHNTNLSLFTSALSNLGSFSYFLLTWRNWKDINSKEIAPKKYNVIFDSVASKKKKKTWFTNVIRITTIESLSTTAPYKRLIDGLSYVYVRTPQLRQNWQCRVWGSVKEEKCGRVACQKSKSADRVLHSRGPMTGPGVP